VHNEHIKSPQDHQTLLDEGFSEQDIADMSPRARARRLEEAKAGEPATSKSDVATGKRDAPIVAETVDDVLKLCVAGGGLDRRRNTAMGISNPVKVLCACTCLAFVYWVIVHRTEKVPTALGWDDLVSCSDSTSLDGTRRLSVSENSHATLYEAHGPSDRRKGHETISREGTWSFDEISKRYLVVLNGETTTYLLVSPESGGMCMLIAGEVQSADLRQSWFSSPADVNHDPGDQATGPDDR
jgi:hypothetical protein